MYAAVGKQNGAAVLAELDAQQAGLQATCTNRGISLKNLALCIYKLIVSCILALPLMQVAWPDMVHGFRPSLIVEPANVLGGLHKDVLIE